jgi:hypothetical protein
VCVWRVEGSVGMGRGGEKCSGVDDEKGGVGTIGRKDGAGWCCLAGLQPALYGRLEGW